MAKGRKTGGRAKGVSNKATKNAREAIGRFVDGNAHRLQSWLDEIAAAEGPEAAVRCFGEFVEYHVPKLQRTDIHANIEAKGEMLVRVEYVEGET